MTQWYTMRNNQAAGPFAEADLAALVQQQRLGLGDFVRTDQHPQWRAVTDEFVQRLLARHPAPGDHASSAPAPPQTAGGGYRFVVPLIAMALAVGVLGYALYATEVLRLPTFPVSERTAESYLRGELEKWRARESTPVATPFFRARSQDQQHILLSYEIVQVRREERDESRWKEFSAVVNVEKQSQGRHRLSEQIVYRLRWDSEAREWDVRESLW